MTNEQAKEILRCNEQQPSEDCVSRLEVIKAIENYYIPNETPSSHTEHEEYGTLIPKMGLIDTISDLPPVTPTQGTCKDCKYWKDSDGVYRRGISAESKCPLNILQVFDGDFYCADFEKRGSEE